MQSTCQAELIIVEHFYPDAKYLHVFVTFLTFTLILCFPIHRNRLKSVLTSSMPEGGPVCLRRARDQGQPEGAEGGGYQWFLPPPPSGKGITKLEETPYLL